MTYALGTIGMGFAAYLVLAWRKREWPFPPSQPAPPGPSTKLKPEGTF